MMRRRWGDRDRGKRRPLSRGRFLLAIAVARYPVLIAFTLTMAVATMALALVLDEQGKGRERDRKLHAQQVGLTAQQVGLTKAVVAIQASRREAVRISCKTNRQQNSVLLALIDLSITSGKQRGRQIDQELLRQMNELLKPITPEVTKAVCDALLEGIVKGPPPPPRAQRYPPPPLVRP